MRHPDVERVEMLRAFGKILRDGWQSSASHAVRREQAFIEAAFPYNLDRNACSP